MSTIDPNAIDPTKPTTGEATTASVRANEQATQDQFQNAVNDIEPLEAHVADVTGNPHVVTAAQTGADPAGSAATVQGNLDTHVADATNPHSVTAAQAGADPAGSAATVQSNLDTHVGDTTNPHAVTAAQANAIPAQGTADGDLVPYGGAATYYKLAVGADGQVLTARPAGGAQSKLVWEDPTGNGGSSPTTTEGDMIYRGATVDVRLPIGTNGQVMKVGGSGVPEWQTDAGAGVNNPPSVKGDLWTFHSSDTQRLPVGNNGDVLRANSGATAGVEWSALAAGGDMLSPATIAIGELYQAAGTDGVQTARSNILATDITGHFGETTSADDAHGSKTYADAGDGVNATNLSNHKAAGGTEHPGATTSVAGFMSGADKTKLDGVADGADVVQGTGAAAGKVAVWGAGTALDGTAYDASDVVVTDDARPWISAEFVLAFGTGDPPSVETAGFGVDGVGKTEQDNGWTADNYYVGGNIILSDGADITRDAVSLMDPQTAATIGEVGFDATPTAQASNYTVSYADNQFIALTGSGGRTITAPSDGSLGAQSIFVPTGITISLSGWTVEAGTDPTGNRLLECRTIAAGVHVAAWVG